MGAAALAPSLRTACATVCVVLWRGWLAQLALHLMHRTVAPFSRTLRPSRWASSGARRARNRVPSCASLPTNQRQLHLAVTDHRQGALGGLGVAQRSCGFPSRGTLGGGIRHECPVSEGGVLCTTCLATQIAGSDHFLEQRAWTVLAVVVFSDVDVHDGEADI